MGFVKIEKWSQKRLQEFHILEVQEEFWLWCKGKNIRTKNDLSHELTKILKMAFKKKNLPRFVFPTVMIF